MVYSDVLEIAQQYKFNLTIPTADEELNKKFRLEKKSFAIACRTNIASRTRSFFLMSQSKNELIYLYFLHRGKYYATY